MRGVVVLLAVLAGTASADDGVFTADLTGGAAYVFSASKYMGTNLRTEFISRSYADVAFAFGFGGFVLPEIALFGRLSCGGLVCFAGPTIQVWPLDQVWLGGGFGFGTDPDCVGGEKTCGVDTCTCDMGSMALEIGAGASLKAFHGASVHVDFVRVGDIVAGHSANSLSVQLGYQWH